MHLGMQQIKPPMALSGLRISLPGQSVTEKRKCRCLVLEEKAD